MNEDSQGGQCERASAPWAQPGSHTGGLGPRRVRAMGPHLTLGLLNLGYFLLP